MKERCDKTKICIQYKCAFGWNIEEVVKNETKCSQSDSHVRAVKLHSFTGTDSFPIFRVLLMVWYNQTSVGASMKIGVYWDVTPCYLVNVHLLWRGTCCLHDKVRGIEVSTSVGKCSKVE
jgi:hypothetical protein